ncbi:hypothetical protein C8J57DRAFT_1068691, partial [Mycena rebaudengoi]
DQRKYTDCEVSHSRINGQANSSVGAETEHAAAERTKIIDWMSLLNFFLRHDNISRAQQAGTGVWLLKDTRFKNWTSRNGSTLWCYGMPGAGKTILSWVTFYY